MTIELHLLRHAHAGDPMKWDGDDADRPLSGKGRDQADRLARHLAAIGFQADVILTSPKAPGPPDGRTGRRPTRGPTDRRRAARRTGDPRRRWSGSWPTPAIRADRSSSATIPDFSDLLALLIGAVRDTDAQRAPSPGSTWPAGSRPGIGVLRWLIPPELIPDRG